MTSALAVGILIYPYLTALDAIGPAQVLARVPGARVHLVWKTLNPVETDAGFSLLPTTTLDACGQLDVLCVPGGVGQIALMNDPEVLSFLRRQAVGARYVTSVCTGSLLLGAAGLLHGYKAACHWLWRDLLTSLDADPVEARVVRDRNRITGGGVTAGIDFALTLAAELAGEDVARGIQLSLEYAPEPPFDCGSPERADPALVARLRNAAKGLREQRVESIAALKGALSTTVTPLSRAVISRRFNGPPNSGNGGYSCGLLAALIGDSAEVTLRAPPPLDREMSIDEEGTGDERRFRMLDGDTLIATGRAADPNLICPEPPSIELARMAESGYSGFQWHHFPTCFVCGPKRAEGDGLRLFTGKVAGRDIVASGWTPSPSVGTRDGTVDRVVVWSALDCPTYFGGRLNDYGKLAVLGRLTVKLVAPVMVGAPHVVIGWPLERHGRKWEGGSAIFTADGELCAFARGLWVEVKELAAFG